MTDSAHGPVVIAYDGSPFAQQAIEQAAQLLRAGLPAVVTTVWQPLKSIPFAHLAVIPEDLTEAMGSGARTTAEEGAAHARDAGFDASPLVVPGDPVWHRIVEVADEQHASVIVIGSRGRSGLKLAVMGSVATAIVQHSKRPVLVGRADD
jgi:nucleotide-binding universal stress UspA family protein